MRYLLAMSHGTNALPTLADSSKVVGFSPVVLPGSHSEFGATIKVTRTPLFDHRPFRTGSPSVRHYDVSRDGRTFLFVKSLAGKTAVEPIIVLNWVEEVRRLMAAAGIR